MNYIKQLESDRETLQQAIARADRSLDGLLSFMHGPKFQGTENGERKDWIATADVIQWLRELRNTLHQNGE
jgi:predicted TPR repeat methyltransferase